MAKVDLVSVDKDVLKRIERNAEDLSELLRGLESTARVIHILGTGDNPNYVDHEDVAHMMGSFREQLTTIRDSVEGIADMAARALIEKLKKIAAVK